MVLLYIKQFIYMKKFPNLACFLLLSTLFIKAQTPCEDGFAGGFPCEGYDLMNLFDKEKLSNSNGSDIWGWTDPATSKEYAITTFGDKTCFIDISDPLNPLYLGLLNSNIFFTTKVWRDVKVYKNHAFIVADNVGAHGMQVFDLTRLRNVTSPPENFTQDTVLTSGIGSSTIASCHNIVINEGVGVAYLVGCNSANGGGPIMVDISDPKNPVTVGQYTESGYTHDAQAVTYRGPDSRYTNKEILVTSNGSQRGTNKVVIIDVTDPTAPQKIAEIAQFNAKYIHQGWFTSNQKYFLVNDELDEESVGNNTKTLIYDFTDLENPIYHSQFFNTTASIDHNLYVKDNLVFQANYTSGMRVLDISDIQNIHEIGYFDTYPENDGVSFNGIWSVYPYFSSGKIILSDFNRGFFIVKKSETLQMENFLVKNPFTIYPNPAKNNPILKSSQNTPIESIEIYSLLGQKIFHQKEIQQLEYLLPTESMVRGMYLVKINGSLTKKLILN